MAHRGSVRIRASGTRLVREWRGVRHEVFLSDMGREPVMAADRVVDMLLAKLAGKPYVTPLAPDAKPKTY